MFALLTLLATLHLAIKDNGKVFTVAPRTSIVVELRSNSSTGYSWHLADGKLPNPKAVVLVKHYYIPPKTSRPGAAGTEVWQFRSVHAGTSTRIGLAYVRTAPPTSTAKTFRVTIRVR